MTALAVSLQNWLDVLVVRNGIGGKSASGEENNAND
jgi:hypothetical protein